MRTAAGREALPWLTDVLATDVSWCSCTGERPPEGEMAASAAAMVAAGG